LTRPAIAQEYLVCISFIASIKPKSLGMTNNADFCLSRMGLIQPIQRQKFLNLYIWTKFKVKVVKVVNVSSFGNNRAFIAEMLQNIPHGKAFLTLRQKTLCTIAASAISSKICALDACIHSNFASWHLPIIFLVQIRAFIGEFQMVGINREL